MGLGSRGSDWFESSLKPGISPPDTASSVVAFVNPEEFFPDLRAEVEATGPGHFIYWIGFEVDGGTDVYLPKSPVAPDAKRPFARRTKEDGDKEWYQCSRRRTIAMYRSGPFSIFIRTQRRTIANTTSCLISTWLSGLTRN